jgi:tryptophanyl-tRNA synthetase
MKRLLADRIIRHYAPARERYLELQSKPAIVDEILAAGASRLTPLAADTMTEVRQKMGLR